FLCGVIGIIIIIIIIMIIDISLPSIEFQLFFRVLFYIVLILIGSVPIIVVIGPIILDEIRNKQLSSIERKKKYRICPQCKELIDEETGICPSCGYRP
ncbi:MAG: hypothetical protein ACFFD2_23855, partial [Promethearchaeota archaeon]